MDLKNMQINTGHKIKTYNMLNANEVACLKAWCILLIAEKQEKQLNIYQFMKKCRGKLNKNLSLI